MGNALKNVLNYSILTNKSVSDVKLPARFVKVPVNVQNVIRLTNYSMDSVFLNALKVLMLGLISSNREKSISDVCLVTKLAKHAVAHSIIYVPRAIKMTLNTRSHSWVNVSNHVLLASLSGLRPVSSAVKLVQHAAILLILKNVTLASLDIYLKTINV